MAETLIIVDDEDTLRDNLRAFFTKHGFHVYAAARGREAVQWIDQASFDLMITDIRLPDMNGLELLKRVAEQRPETPVILITAYASLDTAIRALREGAADYLIKPIQFDEVLVKVRRLLRYNALKSENQALRSMLESQYHIVGQSPAMTPVFETIRRVAPAKSTVLITGESGTGKELVARAIHRASGRAQARFVPINCGAIPETLLESELFGHKKGAFTGAVRDNEGLFSAADGGTLFLDEISALPLSLQAKLLRVIEDGKVTPLGEVNPKKTDLRVICATNRDLREMVTRGEFREDLYFRLNVVEILMPPLRERRDDIPLLVAHFIDKFNRELGRTVEGVTPAAMEILIHRPWHGNVRELENTIERAMIYCSGAMIDRDHLPPSCVEPSFSLPGVQMPSDLHQAMSVYEKAHIRRVLSEAGGNKREAASRLGISIASVYRKLSE